MNNQDLLVLLAGYSWPLILIGFVGMVLTGVIVGFAVDQREKNDINSEAWTVAVRRQQKLVPWAVLFVAMFMTGWAMPEANYDVRIVEKQVVVANSYADLFDRCMGAGKYLGDLSATDAALYERERGARALVCQTVAREESLRQALEKRAERDRALVKK